MATKKTTKKVTKKEEPAIEPIKVKKVENIQVGEEIVEQVKVDPAIERRRRYHAL